MPQIHFLKTLTPIFEAICNGRRRFDLRSEEDKRFEVGDQVVFREFGLGVARRPEDDYTGRSAEAEVLYVLRGPDFGLPRGYAILSITQQQKQETGDGDTEDVQGDAEASELG